MNVKQSNRQNHVVQGARTLARRRGGFLLLFVAYNLLLAALGLGLLYLMASPPTKDEIKAKLKVYSSIGNLLAIAQHSVEGIAADPENLVIDIKHKHLQRLDYVRTLSVQQGSFHEEEESSVPARIRYGGHTYRVELSLKGRMPDHWTEDMFSMKVKVKGDHTIMGMKSFALQHPQTRDYLDEWVVHQLYADAGLLYLRYDFVGVDINGRGSRIYAIEEGFDKRLVEHNQRKEGPIFKFNGDLYWLSKDDDLQYGLGQALWATDLAPMPRNSTLGDSLQNLLFQKAKSLLESFRRNELSSSEVFDVPKFATFLALSDLFGAHHCDYYDNIRFYYNPITSRIEPIIHDHGAIVALGIEDHFASNEAYLNRIIGSEKQIGEQIEYQPPHSFKKTALYEQIFKDPQFYRAYVQALERVSDPAFLDEFFDRRKEQIREKVQIIRLENPLYDFCCTDMLYENQEQIRRALHPARLIEAYYDRSSSQGEEVAFKIVNYHNLPVEIVGWSWGEGPVRLARPRVVQADLGRDRSAVQSIAVGLPAGEHAGPAEVLKLRARILGASEVVEVSVRPFEASELAAGQH